MKRIDIAHINGDIKVLESGGEFDGCTPEFLLRILKALKRSYEREDELIEALNIVRDDLNAALEMYGHNKLAYEKSERTLEKIRNLANDASQ